jgi:hypothetical protein
MMTIIEVLIMVATDGGYDDDASPSSDYLTGLKGARTETSS